MRKLPLTAITSTVLLLLPLFSQAQDGNAEVTGTVAYRERMALPPDAVINVQLLDASIADIAAQTVSDVMINAEGRQVPVSFTLTYDPAKIVPGNRYSVRATIRSGDGMLMFSSTQAYPVLTHGAPSKVNLVLYRVGHGAKPAAATKKQAAPAASENTASDAQGATSEAGAPGTTAPASSSEAAPGAPPPTPAEPDKPAPQAETAPTQSVAVPPTPQPAESKPVAQPEAASPSESSSRSAPPAGTQNEPAAPAPAEALAAIPDSKAAEVPPAAMPENKTEPAASASETKPSVSESPLPEAPSASKGMSTSPAPGDSTEPGADAESAPPARAVPATALTPLANTQWRLIQLNGLDVVIGATQKPVTLAFSPEGRRIAGSAGCNSFLGTYTEEHGVLHLSPGNMTMMFCPDPAGSREKKFIAMLRTVNGYKLNGDFLLLTSNGKTVAKFKTNPPL